MKKKLTGLLILTLLTGIGVSVCQAKTAYVSDRLFLTFREGPGVTHAVIQTLESNTPLTVLEEENGYLKVELATGEQGWVDKKFIVFDLPKPVIIEQLTREKQALEKTVEALKAAAGQPNASAAAAAPESGKDAAALAAQVSRLQQENKKMVQQLNQTRSELAAARKAAEKAVTTTEADNQERNIFRSAMVKWFMAGFGVLLTGWIIGRSVSPRKRSSSFLD